MNNKKPRPQFNAFFTDPWPFSPLDGVGLAFVGAPSDPVAFIQLFQETGCSPPAARRILDELEAGRTKYATVVATINFNDLGEKLKGLHVEMRIVPPAPNPSDQRMDRAALAMIQGKPYDMSEFSPPELELVQLIYAQTLHSMARVPYELGRFA